MRRDPSQPPPEATKTSPAPRARPRWLSPAIVLPLAVLLGIALRLAPCLRDPAFDFVFDGGYHERLTREMVAAGRLADVDRLSNAPEGRRTATHLPLGLYVVGATAHRVLAMCGSRDLHWNLAILVALFGALIAVPVWLGAHVLFRDRRAAAIAVMLAVFLPADVQRTQGYCLRYDGLGTLLVMLHAVLALAALEASTTRRRWLFALGSAVAFVSAMASWRVSLLVLEIELAYAVIRFARRGGEPAVRDLWLSIALIGTLGLAPVVYLSEHRFLFSPVWLSVVGFAVVFALPWLRLPSRGLMRIGAIAAVGALALGLGRFASAADYSGLPSMLGARLGITRGHDPVAALMLSVVELQGMSLTRFLTDWRIFSGLGLVFVVSPLLFAWVAGGGAFRRALYIDSTAIAFAFLATALTVSTFLFQRSCVLVAPLLSITIGGLIVRLWGAGRSPARNVERGRPRPARSRAGYRAFAILVIAATLAAMAAGVVTVATSRSRFSPNEKAAIEYLRDHADPHAIVMCDWDAGYEIQSRAHLATQVDGLLESAENRRRIVELSAAWMNPRADSLEALCRRYHASWLLVPRSSAIYGIASVTGDPLADLLARHEEVPLGPMTDHLIVHLIEGDVAYPGLRRALEAGGYTVFEVVGAPPSP